jgi:hypothetical protein
MQACYLREGSDYLDQARFYPSIADACDAFLESARELDRYGQRHDASLHFVDSVSDEPTEYPDRVLSLGPKGGLKVENT